MNDNQLCDICIGIDPSFSTGLTIFYVNKNKSIIGHAVHLIKPNRTNSSPSRKIYDIVNKITEIISEPAYIVPGSYKEPPKEAIYLIDKKYLFIEGYAFGSFGRSSSVTTLAELGGSIKYSALANFGLEYTIIPPTKVKKFITGKGNSHKDEILLKCFKRYGMEFDNSDIADSYVICHMGYLLAFDQESGIKYADDVIESMRKEYEQQSNY